MDSTTLRSPIEELTSKSPICITKKTPVTEALSIMKKQNIGCLLVTEEESLIGVISERDILNKVVAPEIELERYVAEDIMSREVECLFSSDDIAYALNRMHVGGFRHIPLINLKKVPTGIISIRDIIRFVNQNLSKSN